LISIFIKHDIFFIEKYLNCMENGLVNFGSLILHNDEVYMIIKYGDKINWRRLSPCVTFNLLKEKKC